MKKTKIFSGLAFIFTMTALLGCAGLFKDYGKITPNAEVTLSIERYQVDPDLNYYITGSTSGPNAIIGVKKSFNLDVGLWKKIEMTPDVLKYMVSNMQQRAEGFSGRLQGFRILDNKGREVGIYYTLHDVNAYVKTTDEKTVIIGQPAMDIFFVHEQGDSKEP